MTIDLRESTAPNGARITRPRPPLTHVKIQARGTDEHRRPSRAAGLTALILAGMALTACSTTPGGSTSAASGSPQAATIWATEAQAWIDAWLSAWDAGTGEDLQFYAADATVDLRMLGRSMAHNRAEIAPMSAEQYGLVKHTGGSLYLSADGAVMPLTLECALDGCTEEPVALLQHAAISPDGFEAVTFPRLTWTETDIGNPPRRPDRPGAAEQLTAAYISAWGSGDPDAMRALYAPDATLTASLDGTHADGVDAIIDLSEREATPLHATTAADTFPPAVLATDPDLSADSPVVAYTSTSGPLGRVLLLLGSDAHCPGSRAVALNVDDQQRVVDEQRFTSIASVRACADPGRLPDGWWTGLPLPLPFADRPTGRLSSDAGPIDIRNGTPAADEMIAWALARFTLAGLPPPTVTSIVFDPLDDRCGSKVTGFTEWTSTTSRILICFDSAGIDRQEVASLADPSATGEAAADTPPDTDIAFRNHGPLLLHELSHAWMAVHTDEATKSSFMALVGTANWNDHRDPWEKRGVEWAAQLLTWGLVGRPDMLLFLGDEPPCPLRADAYRSLTGRAPLTTCAG